MISNESTVKKYKCKKINSLETKFETCSNTESGFENINVLNTDSCLKSNILETKFDYVQEKQSTKNEINQDVIKPIEFTKNDSDKNDSDKNDSDKNDSFKLAEQKNIIINNSTNKVFELNEIQTELNKIKIKLDEIQIKLNEMNYHNDDLNKTNLNHTNIMYWTNYINSYFSFIKFNPFIHMLFPTVIGSTCVIGTYFIFKYIYSKK